MTSTAHKVELVNRLSQSGVGAIEVSSFVRRKLVPGLSDAEAVFDQIDRPASVSFECCVANMSGLNRAISAGADVAWFLLSVDEQFSRNNIGRTVEESLVELAEMNAAAERSGIRLGTYIIAAAGGPAGPARGRGELEPLMKRLVDIGVLDWIVADSFGYAAPSQALLIAELACEYTTPERLVFQIHDVRGMGVANVVALASAGFVNIDTALAGSGGHPAMPHARVGGVCTEDAVQALELSGHPTGIDLSSLIEHANWFDSTIGAPTLGFVRHGWPVPTEPADPTRTEAFAWPP